MKEHKLSDSSDSKEGSPDAPRISAIRAGDERAMVEAYERYSAIYSVALRVLDDSAAAEDIRQEVVKTPPQP